MNESVWINDYKTYTTNSFVYQNKDILHKVYDKYDISLNDSVTRNEALEYIISENAYVGDALACVYPLGNKSLFSGKKTVEEILSVKECIKSILECSVLIPVMGLEMCRSDACLKLICSDVELATAFDSIIENISNHRSTISSALTDSDLFTKETISFARSTRVESILLDTNTFIFVNGFSGYRQYANTDCLVYSGITGTSRLVARYHGESTTKNDSVAIRGFNTSWNDEAITMTYTLYMVK